MRFGTSKKPSGNEKLPRIGGQLNVFLRLLLPCLIYLVFPQEQRPSRNMEIIVYSSNWCPDCREAKRFLQKHNLPYREIDIEKTPGAAEEIIQRTGKRAIPQFV